MVGQHITDLIPSLQLPPPGEHVPMVGPQGRAQATGAAWPRLGPVAAGVSLAPVSRVLRPSSMACQQGCLHCSRDQGSEPLWRPPGHPCPRSPSWSSCWGLFIERSGGSRTRSDWWAASLAQVRTAGQAVAVARQLWRAVGIRAGETLSSARPPSPQGPCFTTSARPSHSDRAAGVRRVSQSAACRVRQSGGQAGVRSALLLQEMDPAGASWALPGSPLASG